MQISDKDRSGKIVIEVDNISHSYDSLPIVKNFSTTIMRGDHIGIIGPNGVGKSTLIQLLLGQLQPDEGTVKLGTKLEIAYFDQHRSELDLNKSVRDNLAEGTDKIVINDREKHVISYLSDFLFASDRANSPVSTLSGGERNRLMLAKLFAQPFNMLVMDEPTNDLDVETLELLEELLLDYKGTLLLVSHDRAFLNNVVTSTLVFEGDGEICEFIGDYDDWLWQKSHAAPKTKSTTKEKPKAETKKAATKKLSYKDQRELDELPELIETLENEIKQLNETMSDGSFYQGEKDAVAATTARFEAAEKELEAAEERWVELDS